MLCTVSYFRFGVSWEDPGAGVTMRAGDVSHGGEEGDLCEKPAGKEPQNRKKKK